MNVKSHGSRLHLMSISHVKKPRRILPNVLTTNKTIINLFWAQTVLLSLLSVPLSSFLVFVGLSSSSACDASNKNKRSVLGDLE
jgi:hypothetical protein